MMDRRDHLTGFAWPLVLVSLAGAATVFGQAPPRQWPLPGRSDSVYACFPETA